MFLVCLKPFSFHFFDLKKISTRNVPKQGHTILMQTVRNLIGFNIRIQNTCHSKLNAYFVFLFIYFFYFHIQTIGVGYHLFWTQTNEQTINSIFSIKLMSNKHVRNIQLKKNTSHTTTGHRHQNQ